MAQTGFAQNSTTKGKIAAARKAEAEASAAEPGPAATKLWGQAVQGWGTLAMSERSRLSQAQTKLADLLKAAAAPPVINAAQEEVDKHSATYFEYFFEQQRCSIVAYQNVYAGNLPKLQQKYEDEAQRIVNLEKQNPSLDRRVVNKYANLLSQASMKGLRSAYDKAGGKTFLNKPLQD